MWSSWDEATLVDDGSMAQSPDNGQTVVEDRVSRITEGVTLLCQLRVITRTIQQPRNSKPLSGCS